MICPTCGNLCDSVKYDHWVSTKTFSNGNKTIKTEKAIKSLCCHGKLCWIDDEDIPPICEKMITDKLPKGMVIKQIMKLGYLEIDAEMAVDSAKVNASFN